VRTSVDSAAIDADTVNGSEAGASVALSGDGTTALLGGPTDGNDGVGGTNPGDGAAWIFANTVGGWIQQGSKLAADVQSSFGSTVALSYEGTALIGAPYDEWGGAPGTAVGAAWVIVNSSGVWKFQARLSAADAVGAAHEGERVALSTTETRPWSPATPTTTCKTGRYGCSGARTGVGCNKG
jgi:hypothetical protein